MAYNVLVIGHGTFSEDLVRTAEMICGPAEGVQALNLPADQDMDAYEAAVHDVMERCSDEGLLILADLKGGTPFLTVSRLMREFWQKRVELVTGVNLPMLIHVISSMDLPLEQIRAEAAQVGAQGITDLRSIKERRCQEAAK